MREITVKLTTKGQVTIPLEMRRVLGVEPHDRIAFVEEGGVITLVPSRSVVERTAGMFAGRGPATPPTARELRRIAEEAIAQEVTEEMRRSASSAS